MSIIERMTPDTALLDEYEALIRPHLELAKKAYGSRDTVSPQHDASREYTRLLCEYYDKGGSLLKMAERLQVQYAGIRRRVNNRDVTPSSHRPRKKFEPEVYEAAVKDILKVKEEGTPYEYHLVLYKYYQKGLSLSNIAKRMGLSSANPLYYGVNRIKKGK
jgi:transposase